MSDTGTKSENVGFINYLKTIDGTLPMQIVVGASSPHSKLPIIDLMALESSSIAVEVHPDNLVGLEEKIIISTLQSIEKLIDEDPELAMEKLVGLFRKLFDFFGANGLNVDAIFEKVSAFRNAALRIAEGVGAYEYTIEAHVLPLPGMSIGFHFRIPTPAT